MSTLIKTSLLFPPTLQKSSSTVLPSHVSLKSSASAVRRAARASDQAWRRQMNNVATFDRRHQSPSANPKEDKNKIRDDRKEEAIFQQYQDNIHRQRQQAHRRKRRRKAAKHHGHTRYSDIDDKAKRTIHKASRRYSTVPTNNSMKHLLDLCASTLERISSTVSSPQSMPSGTVASLCDTMRDAMVSLSEHKCQIAVVPTNLKDDVQQQDERRRSRSQSYASTVPRDGNNDEEDNDDSFFAVHKKRWRKMDKKRAQRKAEPAEVLKQVHGSLKDVIRAPVAINDWAEQLLSEDLMNGAAMLTGVETSEFDIDATLVKPIENQQNIQHTTM
jgi:hypothetical protein